MGWRSSERLQPSIQWDEARDEKLRELHRQGLSASLIAARFGDCSRNAVIGRLHRIGLASSGGPKLRKKNPPRRRSLPLKPTRTQDYRARERISVQIGFPTLKSIAEHVASLPPEPKVVFEGEPMPLKISLLELTPSMCRWPIGDEAPFHFCGHPKREGSSYCEHHHARSVGKPMAPVFVPERLKAA